MPRNHVAKAMLTLGTFVLPLSAAAEPPRQMTFRNNLLPGDLTVHRISRVIRRKCERRKYIERLKYKQRAEWVQCNIDEPTPGNIMVYQMLVDRPAEVLSVRHGKVKATPTPPASDFNLPKGSTRLWSAYRTPQDGPVQVPRTDPAQRAILHALMDFAHWPKKRIEAGHRWQRDLYGNGLSGTQTFEFVDLVKIKGDVVARLTLFVQGRFEDPIAQDYVFGKGQAVIYWSRLERMLVKMEAQADYQRKREHGPEEYKLDLEVGLLEHDSLNEDKQNRITDQMIAFDAVLKQSREGHDREARELCRMYRKTWPDSLWLPAVEELESRSAKKETRGHGLSIKQLNDRLVKLIITYEAARTNYEYDLLERTHRLFEQLAVAYRVKLKKLAKSKDTGKRSHAVFVLAFSRRPQDLDLVQTAVEDESSKVRAMALAGFAARHSPNTNVGLLIAALDDEKSGVRRRACQAVAACMPREHYSIVAAVEKINDLMIHDKNHTVRLAAVRALAALGTPVDVPKLEKALTHELNPEIREEIHKAIERLRAASEP